MIINNRKEKDHGNERMHTGELYYPNEESIFDEQLKKLDLLYEFNSTRPTERKRRQALMKEMFAEVGENCYLEPPFHANWDGRTSISATLYTQTSTSPPWTTRISTSARTR